MPGAFVSDQPFHFIGVFSGESDCKSRVASIWWFGGCVRFAI